MTSYSVVFTFFFYIIACTLVILFIWHGERNKSPYALIMGYGILAMISVFRYDIGNDYLNYMEYVNHIAQRAEMGKSFLDQWLNNEFNVEIGFYFFSCLFSWIPNSYVIVIGLYSLISLIFLFYTLNHYNGYHTLGVFMYIVSGIMFCTWDWVRQSVPIMISLYSLLYIEKKQIFHFVVIIACGSLFHKTILILIPFYFLSYIHINKRIIAFVMLIISILYIYGFFEDALMNLMQYADFIDGYEWYANAEQGIEKIETMGYKLRSLFYMFFWGVIILMLPRTEYVKITFLFVGAILFLVVSGSLALTRISYYFTVCCIVALPCVWYQIKSEKSPVPKLLLMVLLVMISILWMRDVITANNRGCTPYDSIFSDNFTEQRHRSRNY